MRKTFTLLFALMALTVSSWATQITWDQAAVQSVGISQSYGNYEPESTTINGITATATAPGSEDYSGFYYDTYSDDHYSYISLDNSGTMTFATSLGVLSSIVIHLDAEKGSAYGYGEGWNYNANALSWTGNAASVVLGNDGGQYGASIHHITSIDFTVVSVPTSTSWNLSDLASIGISQSYGNYEPESTTINGLQPQPPLSEVKIIAVSIMIVMTIMAISLLKMTEHSHSPLLLATWQALLFTPLMNMVYIQVAGVGTIQNIHCHGQEMLLLLF